MFGSCGFKFNDISSETLGLLLIRNDSFIENFPNNRELDISFSGNTRFYKLDYKPLSFTANFFYDGILSPSQIENFAKVFFLDHFAEFIPQDNLHIYHCMANSGSLKLYPSGGIFSIDFSCSSPYSYSGVQNFGISSQSFIDNTGSVDTFPVITFSVPSNGQTIRITNSTSGKFFELGTDDDYNILYRDEVITVDFSTSLIKTSETGLSRYSNIRSGSEFFPLIPGQNNISVSSSTNFSYRFRYLT